MTKFINADEYTGADKKYLGQDFAVPEDVVLIRKDGIHQQLHPEGQVISLQEAKDLGLVDEFEDVEAMEGDDVESKDDPDRPTAKGAKVESKEGPKGVPLAGTRIETK